MYKYVIFYILCKATFALYFEWFAKQGIFRIRGKKPFLCEKVLSCVLWHLPGLIAYCVISYLKVLSTICRKYIACRQSIFVMKILPVCNVPFKQRFEF